MTNETFAAEVRTALERCRENVDAFLALPEATPAVEVVRAFDWMLGPMGPLHGRVGLYVHVHPDETMRTACEELEQELSKFYTELSLHRGLYDRLAQLDASALTDPLDLRVLTKSLERYRRSGVDRDEATREKLRALQEELVLIGQEFDRNIISGGKDFVVEGGHAALAGLPADFLATHPEREDGSVLLSTDPADRLPMVTYLEDGELRARYSVTANQRAFPANVEVLPRLLAKRHELATLLGYDHWADYVTEDKMTGSGAEARSFVERVISLVRSRAEQERAELLAKKRERDPDAAEVLESDRVFLTERVKVARYDLDSQVVRAYFPYERVKQGVLDTSAALYGVEFRLNTDEEVWHPSVECYDVVDDGDVVARFFFDMHPRDGKFKHAAMFHIEEGVAGESLAQAALVCNFNAPTKDDPALMQHDQVTTFFHEVGHLLHQLFSSEGRYHAFAGISTERDFVEVPSQMYEEWAWNADVLRTFAKHHETDEPIPVELVDKLRAGEEYGKGLHVAAQMYYAMLSMTYYDRDPGELDLEATALSLKSEIFPLKHLDGNQFQLSFGHLNGYSAMYYTYMWSLVISKDLFSRFEGDLMNTETASEYRRCVIGRGSEKDAKDLVRDFLGRDYGYDAFERWLAS